MNVDEILNILLELSRRSFEMDEVPVGAVVVKNGEIIGYGMNDRESSKLITGHAEIKAINDACLKINDWRLDDCELYVSLKPCMMCTGAILESRIKKIYYLCERTNVRFECDSYLNVEKIDDQIKYDEYINLLKAFFEGKRG